MMPQMTAGIGLKSEHYRSFLASDAAGLWAEVHPENFMVSGGPRLAILDAVRRDRPLSLHGIGMSLGGLDRPDAEYLRALRRLIDRTEPALVSEHLAWTAHDGLFFADLLPIGYSEAALDRFCRHLDEAQERLGRRLLIENPALYVDLPGEMDEGTFLATLVRRTGCGLLLDINNLFVSATNLGRDPLAWIEAVPADSVGEYHLAGHAPDPMHGDSLLIDTHGTAVAPPVWDLFRTALQRIGPRPTLIERDNNVPPFTVLMDERDRAAALLTPGCVAQGPVARVVAEVGIHA